MKGAVVYYQPELETMPREELDALQLERLQKLVAYVYERIPFYRESFDEAGVKPEDITSLDVKLAAEGFEVCKPEDVYALD